MRTIREQLDSLRENGLYRRLREVEGPQEARVTLDGREVANFASNNYLDLASHPALKQAAAEAAQRHGVGAGASRLVTGTMELHTELERRIAAFEGREAAILYNSGYTTNLGVLTALVGRGDLVAGDRLNHASIVDGCRLSGARFERYRHGDAEHLDRILADAGPGRKLVVTDGVFSVDGDVAPLPDLAEVCRRRRAWLMVDEAHGTGVLGERGRGATQALGAEEGVRLLMGTLSKAVGSFGGYVAGDADMIDLLRNTSRPFIYTTALPPPVCAASIAGLELIENEPERRARLLRLAERLRRGLHERGWDTLDSETQIVPVLAGEPEEALRLSRRLESAGHFAVALRPPTVPAGRCRLRVSVTAGHTPEDIGGFLDAIGPCAQGRFGRAERTR